MTQGQEALSQFGHEFLSSVQDAAKRCAQERDDLAQEIEEVKQMQEQHAKEELIILHKQEVIEDTKADTDNVQDSKDPPTPVEEKQPQKVIAKTRPKKITRTVSTPHPSQNGVAVKRQQDKKSGVPNGKPGSLRLSTKTVHGSDRGPPSHPKTLTLTSTKKPSSLTIQKSSGASSHQKPPTPTSQKPPTPTSHKPPTPTSHKPPTPTSHKPSTPTFHKPSSPPPPTSKRTATPSSRNIPTPTSRSRLSIRTPSAPSPNPRSSSMSNIPLSPRGAASGKSAIPMFQSSGIPKISPRSGIPRTNSTPSRLSQQCLPDGVGAKRKPSASSASGSPDNSPREGGNDAGNGTGDI